MQLNKVLRETQLHRLMKIVMKFKSVYDCFLQAEIKSLIQLFKSQKQSWWSDFWSRGSFSRQHLKQQYYCVNNRSVLQTSIVVSMCNWEMKNTITHLDEWGRAAAATKHENTHSLTLVQCSVQWADTLRYGTVGTELGRNTKCVTFLFFIWHILQKVKCI